MLTFKWLRTATALLLVAATSPVSEARTGTEKGWQLQQDNQMYGTQSVSMTPSQLSIKLNNMGISINAQAPDWQFLMVSEKNKKYCLLPFSEWQKTFVTTASGKNPYKEFRWLFEEVGTEKIAGLNTTHYHGQRYFRVLSRAEMEKNEKSPQVDELAEDKLFAVVAKGQKSKFLIPKQYQKERKTKQLPTPKQLAHAYSKTTLLPASYGIPLRIIDRRKSGEHWLLDTQKAEPKPIAPMATKPPSGYKKVSNMTALALSDKSSSLDSLLYPDGKR
jgi:hypothetical protein